MDERADRRPDQAQDNPKPDRGEGGDDRDRAFPGEKREISRELDAVKTVENSTRDQTDENAAKYAGLDRGHPHD